MSRSKVRRCGVKFLFGLNWVEGVGLVPGAVRPGRSSAAQQWRAAACGTVFALCATLFTAGSTALAQNGPAQPQTSRPKSISDLLQPQAEAPARRAPSPVNADPVGALIAEPPAEKPPPPSFEARSRPSIDLSAVNLRPSDEAVILKTLDDSASHGLHRALFAPTDLADRLQDSDPQVHAIAARELKVAILRYARAQHGQRLAPESFLKEWGVRPEPWNPDKSFAAAVAEDRLSAWIDDLAPPSPAYQALRKALATYRDLAAHGGWKLIPLGPKMTVGDHGVRVLALRARLATEDPQLAPAPKPDLFDKDLAAAVMRYQLRTGLNPTGLADRVTLTQLNATVGERIAQIIANLERWRWIDRDMPATRIEVNIAAEGMTVYDDNHPVLSMRAAPGRPTDQTPMLMSKVESIVVNPPWNVPSSIAQKELWPKEAKHPGYLAAHGFHTLPDGQGGVRLQQEAGPSALGKLKFDFPNSYGVYLHDTPAHSTFANDSRAVSHGCVRLQHPQDLAKLLLKPNPNWTPESLDEQIASGDTKRVKLQTPIPVVILYWTAYVAGGQVSFRTDIYGWDEALLNLLSAQKSPATT